jgi:hypothetical protein
MVLLTSRLPPVAEVAAARQFRPAPISADLLWRWQQALAAEPTVPVQWHLVAGKSGKQHRLMR